MDLACQKWRSGASILHKDDEREIILKKLYDLIKIKCLIDRLFSCNDISTYILSFETGYFGSFKNQIISNYTILNERSNKYTDSLIKEHKERASCRCCHSRIFNRYHSRMTREYTHHHCNGCHCCMGEYWSEPDEEEEEEGEREEYIE